METVFSVNILPSIINSNNTGASRTISGAYITSYNHTISAFGGYDSCQIQIRIKRNELDDYLTKVIGSTVKVMTGQSETVWEGFINEINMTYINSGVDVTIGPIMDLANKVLVRYSEYITGVPGTTTYANSTISQSRYGTFTKILSSASVSAINAENIRDHYLNDNQFPAYNVTISQQDDLLTVTLNCLGYYHLLNTYVYNNTDNVTFYTVREKILEVLAAHPNSIFGSRAIISSNTLSVRRLENEDRNALDIIKGLVAMGSDTNNARMLFGIYNDRKIIYKTVPTAVSFWYRNFRNNKYITNAAGGIVNIASLKPGQYIGINDIPNYRSAGIRSVPRYVFAETINYTAPFSITITGSTVSTLPQKLAKLGISGLN